MNAKPYAMVTTPIGGDTYTGLDQIVNYIYADNGLAGANDAKDIAAGAVAANRMNQIILEAANMTGAAADGVFSADDVVAMNIYIRDNYLNEWTSLHGDDETSTETGFHLVQNDGSNLQYRGDNFVNTVADGIYHMGFAIQDGHFLNEDGNPNATVEKVAGWLTQFFTDHSSTGSGLDRITDLVMADAGLSAATPESDIEQGADAANGMNHMILAAMQVTGANADGWISTEDLQNMNAWLRSNDNRLATWTSLHGDDEKNEETGFHLVQNDGANNRYFGQNLVNTVADGIYHMGFEIKNGTFLNEDGNTNAKLSDVTDWLNYFYVDQSSTATGLDKIVDTIKSDAGLARNTSATDINQGASYADQLNHFVINAIDATGAMADNWITSEDMLAMNQWIRSDTARLDQWTLLHGDDETGSETGYHLVQNDSANTLYFGQNLINTVADGIYHMGFDIQNGRFLNEDGNQNAYLTDVASWLNYFYKGSTLVYGSNSADTIQGSDDAEDIEGQSGNDIINAGGGDDLVNGGFGDDNIKSEAGDDTLVGGLGNDKLDGGDGSDTYRVSGNLAGGWSSFNGYDTYSDTGSTGYDVIKAVGAGDVDIGLTGFGPQSGIEAVDITEAGGNVRLLGSDAANVLDFRGVSLSTVVVGIGMPDGGPIVLAPAKSLMIDGGYGNDTIYGSADDNLIAGGLGNDTMDGGEGSDTYRVTGNLAGGWSSFNGYDTYSDTGTVGFDMIKAVGTGNVDIGLTHFGPQSGIEAIDATEAGGLVRLLGSEAANTLDFRGVELFGNILIEGGYGNDTLYGNSGNNQIAGALGNDKLDGGDGSDTYRVSGNLAGGWSSFNGYDTYSDTGSTGYDVIKAVGAGDVDIGLTGFGPQSGIEAVDITEAGGNVRLLGSDAANVLDFRGVSLSTVVVGIGMPDGGPIVLAPAKSLMIDGGYGNDTIYGSADDNLIAGGLGNDTMDGGEGSDTYRVTGNLAGGWSSFNGYDTYSDTGTVGFDMIKAVGTGNVDIGLTHFGPQSGIEAIDATEAGGLVRLLGSEAANTLDFRGVELFGNVSVDGGYGNDILYGNAVSNLISGGGGNDYLYGEEGTDKLNGGDGNDVLLGGVGVDTINGGSGIDKISYASTTLGSGDLETGGSDIVLEGIGDYIDFNALIESSLNLNATKLSDLTAKSTLVGSVINAENSVAFSDGILHIDLNGDGAFDAGHDFEISLVGVHAVAYNAASDYFMLS